MGSTSPTGVMRLALDDGNAPAVAPLITRGLGGAAIAFILRGSLPPHTFEDVVEIVKRGSKAARDVYHRTQERARQVYISAFLVEVNRQEVVFPVRREVRRTFSPDRRISVRASLLDTFRRAAEGIMVAAAWLSSRSTQPKAPRITAERTRAVTPNRPTVYR